MTINELEIVIDNIKLREGITYFDMIDGVITPTRTTKIDAYLTVI